jgi:protein-tyrosine kinase
MSRIFELLHRLEAQHDPQLEVLSPARPDDKATTATTPPAELRISSSALEFAAPAREAIGKLVEPLFFREPAPQVVVFSAVERSAGCTFIAARAAEILAEQSSGSVCLVDANLRHPALHEIFKVPDEGGLWDVIMPTNGFRCSAKRVGNSRLWVLPSGAKAKANNVVPVGAIRSYIEHLRHEFAHVIVDTAPLNLYNDSLGLAARFDGIVLVLKANSSRRESTQNILQKLKATDVRLLGAVLNQRTFPVPHAIYSRL